MGWILFIVLQFIVVLSGIRQEQRAGMWSWSKFVFAIGFAVLEGVIVIAPIYYFDQKGPYFWPAFSIAWVIAALNFIWMIIVARRWKLPDGRTSLQAYRDEHPK
jgi:uncharacterized membrane protein